jgi:hypothetical protein
MKLRCRGGGAPVSAMLFYRTSRISGIVWLTPSEDAVTVNRYVPGLVP